MQRRMREEELRLTRGEGVSGDEADAAALSDSDSGASGLASSAGEENAVAACGDDWADAGDGWMASSPGAAYRHTDLLSF